uniref:Uncharacterized protein n=1 Tax=Arion vulgaris TaxID=1028688 RepID=A0A0B7AL97_9EUPU
MNSLSRFISQCLSTSSTIIEITPACCKHLLCQINGHEELISSGWPINLYKTLDQSQRVSQADLLLLAS